MLDFLEDECAEKEHSVFLRAQDEHMPGSERQGCFTALHLLESVTAGNAEGCPEAVYKALQKDFCFCKLKANATCSSGTTVHFTCLFSYGIISFCTSDK